MSFKYRQIAKKLSWVITDIKNVYKEVGAIGKFREMKLYYAYGCLQK